MCLILSFIPYPLLKVEIKRPFGFKVFALVIYLRKWYPGNVTRQNDAVHSL